MLIDMTARYSERMRSDVVHKLWDLKQTGLATDTIGMKIRLGWMDFRRLTRFEFSFRFRLRSSICILDQKDSIIALSKPSPTDPNSGMSPASLILLVNAHGVQGEFNRSLQPYVSGLDEASATEQLHQIT
jgi:hypothetical protein